jgi:hypothetical protein
MRTIHDNRTEDTAHALDGSKRRRSGGLNCGDRHNDALDNDVFQSLVGVNRTSLGCVKSEPEIPATSIFYASQSRDERIPYDNWLDQRHMVAEHCLQSLPPRLECPFQCDEYVAKRRSFAKININGYAGAFADLTSAAARYSAICRLTYSKLTELFKFSDALHPSSASDRGGPPLNRLTVAPIVASSQDDVRTVVRVRYLSKALATVRFSRSTRNTFFRGMLNLVGHLARRSFGALAQPAKQSSRRFTQSLHPLLSAVRHEQQHGASDVAKIRFQCGEVRNVER